MISMSDIYCRMNERVAARSNDNTSIDQKKEIIDSELRIYLISKIAELNPSKRLTEDSGTDLSVEQLVRVLAEDIPLESHDDALSPLTHYIWGIVIGLQEYYVTWEIEKAPSLIQNPLVEFDENGLCTTLKTHKETSYVQSFCLMYDIFKRSFMPEKESKVLVLSPSLDKPQV